jgi:hypothetical protein
MSTSIKQLPYGRLPSAARTDRELTGQDPMIDRQYEARTRAVRRLVRAQPDLIVVIGPARQTGSGSGQPAGRHRCGWQPHKIRCVARWRAGYVADAEFQEVRGRENSAAEILVRTNAWARAAG